MSLREAYSYKTFAPGGQLIEVVPSYSDIVRAVTRAHLEQGNASDSTASTGLNPHTERRRKIEQRLRFYRDAYQKDAEDLIDLIFEHTDVKKQRKKYIELALELNVTARVIDEKNILYDLPAERHFFTEDGRTDQPLQDRWDELASDLDYDEFMDEAAKLTDLCRVTLLWATASAATDKASLRILTPDAFDLIPDPRDPLVIAGYLIDWPTPGFQGAAEVPVDKLPKWRLWDEDVEIKIGGDLNMVGDARDHGLGRVPGVVAFARRPTSPPLMDVTTGDDITSAHKKVMFLHLLAARLAKSQGERQPILEGILAGMAKNQAADGERPLVLPPDVRAYMLESKTDPDHYLTLARHTITGVGARYGISYEKFTFAETTSNSLRDLKLRDKKLNEIRRKQIPRWRNIERKLVTLLGFDTTGFFWNPQEEAVPLEPAEELDLLERRIKLGLDSQVNFLIRRDPELTRKLAAQLIVRNMRDRSIITAAQRALNMSSDPSTPGHDPSSNGALGPAKRAIEAAARAAENATAADVEDMDDGGVASMISDEDDAPAVQ
jgi:hypothetical protein